MERRRQGDAPRSEAPAATVELEITDVNARGEGVGRADGLVVFVPRATAGDRVVATIVSAAKRHATARLERIVEPSPDRVEPPCAHQEACGGCPLMTLEPSAALALRARRLEAVLERIGGCTLRCETVVPSPRTEHYRGRVRFAITREDGPARTAYRSAGDPARLVPVTACHIGPPGAARAAQSFLDTGAVPRAVREIEVRHAFATGRDLVVLHAESAVDPAPLRAAAARVVEQLDAVAGVALVTRGRARTQRLAGARSLHERIGDLELELGPTGFLQVNPGAAATLYELVAERLGIGEGDTLLDLYCGAGMIGLHAARTGAAVLGVEADPAAARAGREAARRLAPGAIRIETGPVEQALEALIGRDARFAAVAANPPRRGLGPGVAEQIARLGPGRVVLVSCHPAALARDVRRLSELGWVPSELAAVDMFPHTAHLEAVVSLSREAQA